jgi:hypothetical protein
VLLFKPPWVGEPDAYGEPAGPSQFLRETNPRAMSAVRVAGFESPPDHGSMHDVRRTRPSDDGKPSTPGNKTQ